METIVCIPGDPARLTSIVGMRKNLSHSGSTNGTSLQESLKANLQDVTRLPSLEKQSMLGAARVKDESRAIAGTKGVSFANVNGQARLTVCQCQPTGSHQCLFYLLLPIASHYLAMSLTDFKALTSRVWSPWTGELGAAKPWRRSFTVSAPKQSCC